MKEFVENMDQLLVLVEVWFLWFFEWKSLKFEKVGLMYVDILMFVIYCEDQLFEQCVGILVKVMILCFCFKEISEYSVYNQRGMVSIWVDIYLVVLMLSDFKVDLFYVVELNVFVRLYLVFKCLDEKVVMEIVYENLRFVEDFVRLIVVDLYEFKWVLFFEIECCNEELIYFYDVYVKLCFLKQEDRI